MAKEPVETTVKDGKVVKTTWAETRDEAKYAEMDFRRQGAETHIFHGASKKYRIVGYWS